jgi:N-ethylmaleimide reductase
MYAALVGPLFSPVRLGRLDLPNRIVMAPMTRSRADAEGVPGPPVATYYAQRATAGLIISEAAHVAPEGLGYPGTPGLHTAQQVVGWREVTTAVHARGGRIFAQLWHVGRVSHPCMQPDQKQPVAPSAIAADGQLFTRRGRLPFVTPRALETAEIPGLVAQFEHAARLARQAGFDGVDIHGGNGYLIDQFLRDGTNHRADRYGGSVANRARFLLEVTEAITAVWGNEALGVRLSPMNPYNSMRDSAPLEIFCHVAAALNRIGIGYLHVAEPGPGHPNATPAGLQLLRSLRAAFEGCFLVDGGRDKVSAEHAMRSVGADVVALATPFIANPDLVERLRSNLPLASADPSTFYAGGTRGFTDYPSYHGSSSAERGPIRAPNSDTGERSLA